jgi:hypothetical protein
VARVTVEANLQPSGAAGPVSSASASPAEVITSSTMIALFEEEKKDEEEENKEDSSIKPSEGYLLRGCNL